ncbi:MAG: GspH/FimT family protein [Porticoccaceae bacterium]|jgi:type IV fimbrial biogenesis protein FimT|nr:GspH/FimT family protein [Porticoccaceae bacterium]MDG1308325.1 GspH/FimT family protein [Porticoccaceae bacterium]
MNLTNKNMAFTLLELLITLIIVSILATLAAPSWSKFIAKQKINIQVWELRRTLELARSFAVSQHLVWKVCMAAHSLVCVKEQGQRLLVFADLNNDHRVNKGEVLIKDIALSGTSIKLSASGRAYVRFKPTGEAMDSGNFLVCSNDQSITYGRQAIVFRSGRIRLSKDTDNDGYDDRVGKNIKCHKP